MANSFIYKPATISATVNTAEETVYTYVNNNPGRTEADIEAGSGLSLHAVTKVIDTWSSIGIFQRRYPATGGEALIYIGTPTAQVFGADTYGNRGRARQWIRGTGEFIGQNNEGKTITDMALALGITSDKAQALALALRESGEMFLE